MDLWPKDVDVMDKYPVLEFSRGNIVVWDWKLEKPLEIQLSFDGPSQSIFIFLSDSSQDHEEFLSYFILFLFLGGFCDLQEFFWEK